MMAQKWAIVGLAGGALLLVAAPLRAQSSDDMQRAFERQRDNTKERAADEADEQPTVNPGTEQQTRKAEEAAKDETEAAKSSPEESGREAQAGGSAAGRQGQADRPQQTGKAKQTSETAKPVPTPDPTTPALTARHGQGSTWVENDPPGT